MTFIEEVQSKVRDILGFVEKQEVEHQQHIDYLVKQLREKDRLIRKFETNMDLVRIAVTDGIEPLGYDEKKADDFDELMSAFELS